MTRFGIIGGGAWGTALAQIIANSNHSVHLWMRDHSQANLLNKTHENKTYLPGIQLNPKVQATAHLSDILSCQILIAAIPAQKTRSVLKKISQDIKADTPVILTSKGIEQQSLKFQHQVLKESVPQSYPLVLSGPSFAKEVAKGLPTAIVLAKQKNYPSPQSNIPVKTAPDIIKLIGQKTFRPYLSTDLLGVQIGGCVKNVLAIACGIVKGKGFGHSAHAALMTRGFSEMIRLGKALGARPETLTGLSGLGDLTLTCFSALSRNMQCGIRLGKGETLQHILETSHSIEGVASVPALVKLAENHQIDMPIIKAVHDILLNNKEIPIIIDELLSRPFREESIIGNRL